MAASNEDLLDSMCYGIFSVGTSATWIVTELSRKALNESFFLMGLEVCRMWTMTLFEDRMNIN